MKLAGFFLAAALMAAAMPALSVETLTDEQIQALIQQDRERILKEHNITVAKSGEYPVTIFDPEQVPLPYTSYEPFKWVDNDTLIYVKTKRSPQYDKGDRGNYAIITVNLKTLEKNEIVESGKVCYDTESKQIVYSERSSSNHGIIRYGTFGQPMKTFEYSYKGIKDGELPYYTNTFDCTFTTSSPDMEKWKKFGRPLRDGDGYFKRELHGPVSAESPGEFVFTSNDGIKKQVKFTSPSGTSPLHYDYYSQHYWFGENFPDQKKSRVVYLDKKFNIVKEEIWPSRDWTVTYAAKDGFIYSSITRAQTPDGKLIRGKNAEIYHSSGGMSLIKHNSPQKIRILEGSVKSISISPDGCKAAFLYRKDLDDSSLRGFQVGLIELCRNHAEGEIK